MSTIITNELRQYNKEAFVRRITEHPTYIFIGKETPWEDDQIPDIPKGSQQELLQTRKDIIGLKKINKEELVSVTMRVNWSPNYVYDEYRNDVNMNMERGADNRALRFYVLTDDFIVYKCLSNNNGAPSTVKPTSNQTAPFKTADGYVWKYMYTLKSNDVFSYLTEQWMPVYTLTEDDGSIQWQSQMQAVDGSLSKIDIISAGSGYSVLTPPTIVIEGDGEGATATATIDQESGMILEVDITNYGKGYTYATATVVTETTGVGGYLDVVLAPRGGHGRWPIQELGGHHIMIHTEISGTTDTNIPTTSFRQVGVVSDVLSTNTGVEYSITPTDGIVVGANVTGSVSNAIAKVHSVSYDGRRLYLSDVIGQFVQNEDLLIGDLIVETTDVIHDANLPLTSQTAGPDEIITYNSNILYISNREKISRSETQTEELRLVITF